MLFLSWRIKFNFKYLQEHGPLIFFRNTIQKSMGHVYLILLFIFIANSIMTIEDPWEAFEYSFHLISNFLLKGSLKQKLMCPTLVIVGCSKDYKTYRSWIDRCCCQTMRASKKFCPFIIMDIYNFRAIPKINLIAQAIEKAQLL